MTSQLELEKLVNDVLEPYAKELGHLLHDWNDLHIAFTHLFLAVCQSDPDDDQERDLLLAIWNAVPNDRLQRNMLRKATKSRFSRVSNRMSEIGIEIDIIKKNEVMQMAEIVWAVESADVLGRKRDDSAHLPVIFSVSDRVSLVADDGTGHPIAMTLKDKDILAEFNLTRARVSAVRNHVWALWSYLVGGGDWPKRPAWPS